MYSLCFTPERIQTDPDAFIMLGYLNTHLQLKKQATEAYRRFATSSYLYIWKFCPARWTVSDSDLDHTGINSFLDILFSPKSCRVASGVPSHRQAQLCSEGLWTCTQVKLTSYNYAISHFIYSNAIRFISAK